MAAAGRWRRLRPELHVLGVSTVITVLSVVLTPSDSALQLFGWTVPPLCLFKALFDLECWGCGLTRSFTYMGHGQLDAAWAMHKLGPGLYALVALQMPYRALRLAQRWSAPPPPPMPPQPVQPPPPPSGGPGVAPRLR